MEWNEREGGKGKRGGREGTPWFFLTLPDVKSWIKPETNKQNADENVTSLAEVIIRSGGGGRVCESCCGAVVRQVGLLRSRDDDVIHGRWAGSPSATSYWRRCDSCHGRTSTVVVSLVVHSDWAGAGRRRGAAGETAPPQSRSRDARPLLVGDEPTPRAGGSRGNASTAALATSSSTLSS